MTDGLMENFNASIECVASAYYCLQSSFQYLALEIQLKRRLRNYNRCSLSKDRYAAYRGTDLPSSPFDSRSNMK